MNNTPNSFSFATPADRIGELLGQLNGLGATLGNVEAEDANGMIAFTAQIPVDRIADARVLIATIPFATMSPRV